MATPNLIILYVESAAASAAFYRPLIGVEPIAGSENFIAFPLPNGFTLGLWATSRVAPPPATDRGARAELAFMVASPAQIEALYAEWQAAGVMIEQALTTMDFGPTFVALDPDGHRLRVCLFDA